MPLYSEKVMDHFINPRNLGIIEDADAFGEVNNNSCGDIIKIYLKIEEETVSEIKFETFGCCGAIASASMATVLGKGKSLSDLQKIDHRDISLALDGLPPEKIRCAILAEKALKAAVENYYESGIEKGSPFL